MSISPTNVYIVNDDHDFGEALEHLFKSFGFNPRSFAACQAFLEALPTLRPGCLFVGLAMPDMSGIDLLRRLRAAGCGWPVVILGGQGSAASAEEAMREGALAFLAKPAREIDILTVTRKSEYSLGATPQAPHDEEIARRIQGLPRRERAVLEGILEGLLNRQLAARLGIPESAVKSARRALMVTMQAKTRSELIVMALRAGMKVKTGS